MQQLRIQPAAGATREDPSLPLDLEILRGICHAFGSSPDLGEASRALTRWVQAAVRDEPTAIGIFVPDRQGRLSQMDGQAGGGRALARPREAAFGGRKPRFLHLDNPERGVAILPLVCRGEAVGLIEVIGPPAAVLRAWSTLEAIASQFAIVVKNIGDRDAARHELSMLQRVTSLMQELVKVDRSEDAVRVVMSACHQWGYQSAAWLSDGHSADLRFVGVRGLGSEGRVALRSRMRVINRGDISTHRGRQRVASRFASVVGAKGVTVIGTRDAVLILAGVPRAARPSLKTLETLLDDVLAHVGVVSVAHRRHQNLDLRLAWTAHEIRQPLVSVRLFVDRLLQMPWHNDKERSWLVGSLDELERLIVLVEDVLRWSAGGEGTNKKAVDIVTLTEGLVRSRGSQQDRVRIDAPGPMTVVGDKEQLGAALRNLIDNALCYSPEEVVVSVGRSDGDVVVSVKDCGPGIPRREQRRIFDPFARGETGRVIRNGTGLGLFIARRAIEAHGGAIWLESNGKGATFKIRLPAEKA
ncbi:MAG: sensor histidine kinase [Actinomycetota bacterium]